MGAGLGGGAAGIYLGDWSSWPGLGTILSLLNYNRDARGRSRRHGARLLADAGYDPGAMRETGSS